MGKKIILNVIMEWNEQHQQYLMKDAKSGFLIYEYWDCKSVRQSFKGINKIEPKKYIVTIEEL